MPKTTYKVELELSLVNNIIAPYPKLEVAEDVIRCEDPYVQAGAFPTPDEANIAIIFALERYILNWRERMASNKN